MCRIYYKKTCLQDSIFDVNILYDNNQLLLIIGGPESGGVCPGARSPARPFLFIGRE